MAIFGFKGLGWFLCCAIFAPGCYVVTSQGATERAKLASFERQIVEARKDLRNLETEFNTRANMAQLQQWNGEVLTLAAPGAQQYLANEEALADLDRVDGAEVQVASLVVPAGARPQAEPAAETAVVRSAAAEPARPAPSGTAQASGNGAATARNQAVAMLDDTLLADLKKRAQAEQLALR